jgi:hypothetical protein
LKQTVVAEKIEINPQIEETRFAKPVVPETPPPPASPPN